MNLPYRIRCVSFAMSRRFRELLAGHGLTPSQWGVLCCLWQQDGQTVSMIGTAVDLLPGTATPVLRNLEQAGLIRRRRDKNDQRVWRIWLTPPGRRLEATLLPQVDALIRSYFSTFTDPEVAQLSDLIDRLLTVFSSEPG